MGNQEDVGRDTMPIEWGEFMQRLDAFADEYCRVKPSLGMIGMMLWTLGCDFDFRLVPREPDDVQPLSRDSHA